MAGSLVVPYVRARGEALGVTFSNVGLVQRPERFALLGVSLLLSPIVDLLVPVPPAAVPHRLLAIGLVVLAVMTTLTSLQRLWHAERALRHPGLARRSFFGRGSAARNAFAGFLATSVDLGVVFSLVQWARLHPAIATFVGCAVGAVTNFLANRFWAFESRRPTMRMAIRYGFVSLSSAGLNAASLRSSSFCPTRRTSWSGWSCAASSSSSGTTRCTEIMSSPWKRAKMAILPKSRQNVTRWRRERETSRERTCGTTLR